MKRALSTLAVVVSFAAPAAYAQEPCPAGTEPRAEGGCAPKVDISCPAGTIFEEGKGCVAKVVECPAGMIVDANKCVPRPAPPPPPPPPKASEPPRPAPPPEPEGPPKRFTVGVRVGFAFPLLNAYRDAKDESAVRLGNELHGALPIALELGYRVLEPLYVGVLGSFGPAFPRSAGDGYCSPSATSCTGDHLRVAVQARFHPLRGRTIDPWVGLGFGYERLSLREEGITANGDQGSVEMALSGVEFFDVSVGANYSVLRDLAVGPFLSFTLGQYGRISVDETLGSGSTTSDSAIKNTSPHAWLVLGVRGAFGLF